MAGMRSRRPPVSAPDRRKRRRSRFGAFVRNGSRSGRLPAFLLSVGLAVLVFGFLFSGDFPVKVVVVQGNNVAYADAITELSGAMGESIFSVESQAIAQRVATHPAVASVNVTTEFPDRVVIRLNERVPVLAWHTRNQVALVDERGDVIAIADDPTLPVLVQTSGNGPAPGTRVTTGVVQAALYVHEKMGSRLVQLGYDPTSGLTAQLNDGRTVVFGDGNKIPLKVSVLQTVLTLPDQWTRLDVRQPDRPYYQ
jgi:cell division protein FtsQ